MILLSGFFVCCLLFPVRAGRAAAADGGFPLGPAQVFPTLIVTETYDVNYGLISEETERDWVTSISPGLRLVLPVRRFQLGAQAGVDVVRYSANDGENNTQWFVGASAGAEFPGGLSFKVGDTHTHRYLVTSLEFGAGEESTLNKLEGTVSYTTHRGFQLELSGLRSTYAFDRSAGLERAESTVRAALYAKFRPSISVGLEGSSTEYSYESNDVQDGSAMQVALGLVWEITGKSTGFANAGYQWKRYDREDQSLGTEAAGYYTLTAGLRHSLISRTAVQVDLTRASQESGFLGNPYFIRTALRATIAHRFTTKLYARAGLLYGDDEYPHRVTYTNPYDPGSRTQTGTRTDTTIGGNLAVGFDYSRWLTLELAYADERRTSAFDTFEYEAGRVSLSAKAAFW